MLKSQAIELGFPLVGVATATTPARLDLFHQWLASGFAGEMHYLERRRQAYEHPAAILQGCQSLLMLGMPYLYDERQRSPQPEQPGTGKIARYAQCGTDYHDFIRVKLKQLKRWFELQCPSAKCRGVVDTAPLHEREFAAAAGLGWIGKNSLLLHREWGSYFFLAALLTDAPLEPDEPLRTDHCGTCTACIDHCPTDALVAPYVMDARRCLSYVTIESPGLPLPEIAEHTNGWIFGCDICQEVCPWNRRSHCSTVPTWQPLPEFASLNLLEVLDWDEEHFLIHLRNSPLWRPRRRGLVRNAMLLAGSQRLQAAVGSIASRLRTEEAMLRAAAAWALGQIANSAAQRALENSLETEVDDYVRDAIAQALCSIASARNRESGWDSEN